MSSRSQKVAKEHHFKNAYEEEDVADRLEAIKQRLQKAREDMPRKVLAPERSAILRAMLAAEVDHIQARLDVIGTKKPFSATSTPLQTVAHLFQRSRNTIHEVYDKALKDGEQGDSEDEDEDSDGDDGQVRGGRPRRINATPELRSELSKKIHAQRASGKCVNAIHVLNWLIELQAITCDKRNLLQYHAALRCTQRFVHDVGFAYGIRKATREGEEHNPNSAPIKAYLEAIMENRSQPPEKRLREAHFDESFIHVNASRWSHSIYDPQDKSDKKSPPLDKGQRYVF